MVAAAQARPRRRSMQGTEIVVPATTRRVDIISQAELSTADKLPSASALAEQLAAAEKAAAASSDDSKSLWNKATRQVTLMGKFAEATSESRANRLPLLPASAAERTKLLEATSAKVDDLVRLLSDWDSEFRGDGSVSRRDWRRALSLIGVRAERHVADALFDHLKEMQSAGWCPPSAAPAAKASSVSTHMPPSQPASAGGAEAEASALSADAEKESMEIWVLDRCLRVASGSKAKKSNLLNRTNSNPLFADSNRTVQEQLRDALVDHSMRVMDLFREWDEDGNGEISREEFRRALPMLGLHASTEQLRSLFDEFDVDGSDAISFRELNRQLRRDVKNESKKVAKVASAAVELADVNALRRAVRQEFLGFSNVQVPEEEDPLTGMPRSKMHERRAGRV